MQAGVGSGLLPPFLRGYSEYPSHLRYRLNASWEPGILECTAHAPQFAQIVPSPQCTDDVAALYGACTGSTAVAPSAS